MEVLDCGNAGPDSGGEVPVHIQERTREVPDRTVEVSDGGGTGVWKYWTRSTCQGDVYDESKEGRWVYVAWRCDG